MDEDRFWSMIESAWEGGGGKVKSRQRLAAGRLSEDGDYSLQEARRGSGPGLAGAAGRACPPRNCWRSTASWRGSCTTSTGPTSRNDGRLGRWVLVLPRFHRRDGPRLLPGRPPDPDRAVMDAECEAMCYLSWTCTATGSGKCRRRASLARRSPIRRAGRRGRTSRCT